MNKKNVKKDHFFSDQIEDETTPHNLLQHIQKKLDSSAALNGGFDRLLYKIDGIEKAQVQIVEKVDKIHDAIYHPDDGLFARLAATKASQIESVSKIEKQVFEISAWKQQKSEQAEDCEKEADELQLKIQKLENSIQNIEKFQSGIFSVSKWFLVAIGGAIVSLIVKILYKAAMLN